MISLNSIITYIMLNGGLLLLSLIQYIFMNKYFGSYLFGFMFTLLKNISYLFATNYLLKVENRQYEKINNISNESLFYLNCASMIETIAFYKTGEILCVQNNLVNYFHVLILFIPISFVVEIIFDFFHYWTHRTIHTYPILYKWIHKTHHTHVKITPIITFHQDISDFILTNFIPFTLSLLFVQTIFGYKFNLLMYSMLNVYKEFLEITGHGGGNNIKSYGFPQFIWLPRFFNIHIVRPDHKNHHTFVDCNYSKRFVLWDKLFGTYKYT